VTYYILYVTYYLILCYNYPYWPEGHLKSVVA